MRKFFSGFRGIGLLGLLLLIAVVAVLIGSTTRVTAQSSQGNFTVLHGSTDLSSANDIVLSSATAGTTNGASVTGASALAVSCTFNQSAHSNTPSTTMSI